MKKFLVSAVVLAAVASMLAAPAFAAKGGKGVGRGGGKGAESASGYELSLNGSDPRLGDTITFTFSADGVREPRIQVMCSQGDELVYGESGPATNSFLLGGGWSLWRERGGSANCVADLYYWDWNGNNPQVFVGLKQIDFTAAG